MKVEKRYLMNTLDFRDIEFLTGYGSELQTEEGEDYLDFFCDVGTASLGYGSPDHTAAVHRTFDFPIHAPNLYRFAEREKAARRICEATEMDRVFFCNSGTESVEAAIKLARKYQYDAAGKAWTARSDIWSQEDGFHGRTMGALAAGDGPLYHTKGFGPLPQGFRHFAAWDISTDIPKQIPKDAAAVIIAPIFGNNDVIMPPDGWLKDLRAYTKEHGMLLIFDEVQTGSGRTGAMTYAQKIGVKPDIITLAKGIAMGCPVGVMLATEEVAKAFTPGTHFSTFGGNPLSCVYVNTMLDWLQKSDGLAQVDSKGAAIKTLLDQLGWPKNIRGEGMLLAFDIDVDGLEFARRCLEQKLLIGAFRSGPGAVKVTPPLNINAEDIQEGIRRMDAAYQEIIKSR